MNNTIQQYESGNTRIKIVQDLSPIHPWILNLPASSLAWWNDEYGSYIPLTGNDQVQERLSKDYHFIELHDDMQAWIDDAKNSHRPYLVYGMTHFDKYGGIVLHKDEIHQDNLMLFDGAIFIDEEHFRKHVDSISRATMSANQMVSRMEKILQEDFNMLNCYASGASYGVVHEIKCEYCNMWKVHGSIWGYDTLATEDSEEWKEMLLAMINNFDDTDELFNIELQIKEISQT